MLHWNKIRLKYLRISSYGIWASGIIAFAALIRIVLIAQGWPVTIATKAQWAWRPCILPIGVNTRSFFMVRTIWVPYRRILVQPCFISFLSPYFPCGLAWLSYLPPFL